MDLEEAERLELGGFLAKELRAAFGRAILNVIESHRDEVIDNYPSMAQAAEDAAVGAALSLLLTIGVTPRGAARVRFLYEVIGDSIVAGSYGADQ